MDIDFQEWFQNKEETETKYGPISEWKTERVTDMSILFIGKQLFNEDISKWNVSNVTDMKEMFRNAIAFDQQLDSWNVSNVKNMETLKHFYNIKKIENKIFNFETF